MHDTLDTPPRPTVRRGSMLLVVLTAALACADPSSGPQQSPSALQSQVGEMRGHSELTSPVGPVLLFVTDSRGVPLTETSPPGTPVFGHLGSRVTAPDGHQLTFSEFTKPMGKISLECNKAGTEVEVHLKGLVPKGLYTMWLLIFERPGFDPTFAHLTGLGAVGPNDGSANSFTAKANGTGELETVIPAGRLSMGPADGVPTKYVTSCLLTSEFEIHIVGGYHYPYPMPKQALWPNPGPDEKFIEQFGAVFNP
ncbi:MAG: hypothetical protein NVS1B4_25080 [Gemmatimonadaceae bacterium]